MKQGINLLGFRGLVFEAVEKSGALITAEFNLEQGREVFAIPGNITLLKTSGTNSLIKAGAILIDSPEPFLKNFYPLMMKA
mgnify:CR=1 FL=1